MTSPDLTTTTEAEVIAMPYPEFIAVMEARLTEAALIDMTSPKLEPEPSTPPTPDPISIKQSNEINDLLQIITQQNKDTNNLRELLGAKGVSGRKLDDALFLLESGETAEDALSFGAENMHLSTIVEQKFKMKTNELAEEVGKEKARAGGGKGGKGVKRSLIVTLKVPGQKKVKTG